MDPDTNPAGIKQRLGVVPQETNLDPDFTCYGNLFTYAGISTSRRKLAINGPKNCWILSSCRRNGT